MKTISATSVATYQNCPKQWQFKYVYHLLEPENPAFIIGTAYHKALELYHTGKDKDSIIEELKKMLLSESRTKEEIDRFASVRRMFEKYILYSIDGETVQTEYKFCVPLFEGINLIGYIDRVTPDSIIDYKTSSFDYEEDMSNNIQADIYSYVYWKEKGEMPNVVFQIMNKKKANKDDYKPQVITFKKTEEDMKNLEVKLKEFYDNVLQEKFEPKEGKYCMWCPFKDNCPIK